MSTAGASVVPSVLIVDDYADTTEMYAAYLGLVGYRPLQAHNGHEALLLANTEAPDIILMDLSLPGLDGFEVTRRLKSDPRTRHIPVVALTAHASLQQFDQLLATGFHDLLLKPCLPDELAEQVRRVLRCVSAQADRATARDDGTLSQPAA